MQSEFIGGKEIDTFEKKFAKYLGVKEVVSVASGTAALFLSLKALKIQEWDEVITNAISFNATPEAIMYTWAKPVFVDVKKEDSWIDCDLIEEKITPKTKAILVVHLYGVPADMAKIKKICKKYNLLLIEDCAQAHGAEYKNKKIWTFWNVGCFSFMPAKNLWAYGDAWCIATDDVELASTIRKLKDHGRSSKYTHVILWYAERMDNLQAGILNIKLPYLDKNNKKRNEIAEQYNQTVSQYVNILKANKHKYSSYYIYPVWTDKRDELVSYLKSKNIATSIYYPIPLHKQPIYQETYGTDTHCPVADMLADTNVAIPMHPYLSTKEVKYIIKEVCNFFRQAKWIYNKNYVTNQYKRTENLSTRLSFWEKYSTNKTDLHDYVIQIIKQNNKSNLSVLDIWCGTGKLLDKLHKSYPKWLLSGIDSSAGMVKKTNNLLKNNANILLADAINLPHKDDSFDIIVSTHVAQHVESHSDFLSEVIRVLKPWWAAVISVPCIITDKGLNFIHYKNVKKLKMPKSMQDIWLHGIYKNKDFGDCIKAQKIKSKHITYKNNMLSADLDAIMEYYTSSMIYRWTTWSSDPILTSGMIKKLEAAVKKDIQAQIKEKWAYSSPADVDIFIIYKE